MPAGLLTRFLGQLGALLGEQVRGWLHGLRGRLGRAWATRPAAARQGAILLCAALGLAGVASLVAQELQAARLPSPLDWRAAAALLARDARPGDAVVVAPPWLERARELAPHGLPVVAPSRLEGEPLPGVRRAWLLGAPEAPGGSAAAARVLLRQASATDARRLGGLEVLRADLGTPLLPLAVLADRAPAGAAVTARDLHGLAHRCLRLELTPQAPIELRFPAVPLGRTMQGQVELIGPEAAPVQLRLLVDGEPLGAADLAGAGWRPFRFDTTTAAPGPRDLTLEASAPAGPRTLCLEALALP